MMLAESGNLRVMRYGSANWIADARLLIEAGDAAYKAAGKRRECTRGAGGSTGFILHYCHKPFPSGDLHTEPLVQVLTVVSACRRTYSDIFKQVRSMDRIPRTRRAVLVRAARTAALAG